MPSIDRIFPDLKQVTAPINELEAIILKDSQECSAAIESRQRAEKENFDFNRNGREQARAALLPLLEKLKAAEERLYVLETTGQKFSMVWLNVTNQIEAYKEKRLTLNWKDREFNNSMVKEPWLVFRIYDCEQKQNRLVQLKSNFSQILEESSQAKNEVVSNAFWTIFSFFLISMFFYSCGWSIAWIRYGFKK